MTKVQRLERERDNLVATLEATPINKDASAIIRRLGALNVAIADAKLPKRELAVIRKRMKRTKKRLARNPSKAGYVSRPSQITKQTPTKRLRKRRKKNLRAPRKGFFPNPSGFVICARTGQGPKMHYDGKNFSQRPTVKHFSSSRAAEKRARELMAKHPVLSKYRITVESPPRPK